MLTLSEYRSLDAMALALGVRNRDFTSEEVTTCAIEQAEKVNPILNAINIATTQHSIRPDYLTLIQSY